MTVAPKTPKAHPLVGRGMHLLDGDDAPQWQGKVIADLGDGYLLVQLYEWIVGEPSNQVVLHISTLAASPATGKERVKFFDSTEDAAEWYDRVGRHRSEARLRRLERSERNCSSTTAEKETQP